MFLVLLWLAVFAVWLPEGSVLLEGGRGEGDGSQYMNLLHLRLGKWMCKEITVAVVMAGM